MNEVLKWGLIGLGGFALYEWWMSQQTTVASTTTTPAPATTTIVSTTVPTVPTVNPCGNNAGGCNQTTNSINAITAIARTSPTALQNAAVAAGYPAPQMFTASQWNFFFTQLTGASSWGIGDSGAPMNVGAYWILLNESAATLQGLGEIINLVDLYKGKPNGSGFGTKEFTALGRLRGLGVIVDDPNNSAAYIDETGMVAATQFNGSQDSTTVDFYNAVQAGGLTVYDS